MIAEKIKALIRDAAKRLEIQLDGVHLEHPDVISHGDYSTNVALIAAKAVEKPPRDIAESIKSEIEKNLPEEVERVEVAGPGFLNFHLSRQFFADSIENILKDDSFGKGSALSGKKVLFEYTVPNPFKPFHIGHLMSNAIGETLSRIADNAGAEVIRDNYQGDIGLHVAKAIYGICFMRPKDLWKEKFFSDESSSVLARWIGECYSEGATAYETDEEIKKQIDDINKKIYDKSDAEINAIYDQGRKITLEAFEPIYEKLGTKFDEYFFESEMVPVGLDIVRKNTPKVFEESQGAIVFRAERQDPTLHTRVFVTSLGLPTYEAKELGLAVTKLTKINPDISITVTASEQSDYMRVVTAAIGAIYPDHARKMQHVTHGMMRFVEGKMSSRKGNIITGESLISEVEEMVEEKIKDRELSEEERKGIKVGVAVGAIKYSILRQSPGKDIIFDREKSLSFEGDSGPYLQYALVRAKSILAKSDRTNTDHLTEEVSLIEQLLYRFPEITARAWEEKAPQLIVEYLTQLAGAFNRFYADGLILSDALDSSYKLAITKAFGIVMKRGLTLLGIPVLAKM